MFLERLHSLHLCQIVQSKGKYSIHHVTIKLQLGQVLQVSDPRWHLSRQKVGGEVEDAEIDKGAHLSRERASKIRIF